MKLLITGANGFVGSQLTSLLEAQGHQLLLAVRADVQATSATASIGDIDTFDNWEARLSGIDTVIHLAARVHQMDEQGDQAILNYQRTNVDATVRLAQAAVKCGIKRFIFLSSIKVNGEETHHGKSFSAMDAPAPKDAYGESKLQAELALKEISSNSAMELVIIRPSLVYGPGVKANFIRLVELARSGMPLPFAGLKNYRDMVSVDNLCDLIAHCIDKPEAAGKTLLVSDGMAYSTADIVTAVRVISGLPQRIFYFSPGLVKILLSLAGKRAVADRLLGNLQVDISATIDTLGWTPKYTLEQTLRKMLH